MEGEEDEEELLRRDPLLPAGTQRVCLVHPEVKWGPGKPQGTRGDRERGAGGGKVERCGSGKASWKERSLSQVFKGKEDFSR